MSGGSATNYGTWARGVKGARGDYDYWAKVVGDEGWGYEGLLPYFKRTETCGKKEGEQHGYDGPIHNISISKSSPDRRYPLREEVYSAWNRVGVKDVKDANAGSSLVIAETVENWKEGKRQLGSEAYDLSGVQVLTDMLVQRVVVEDKDGVKKVTGVELADGRSIAAKKEVVISAGAYRTPQLLMLSGIGPKEELTKVGIPVVHNAPEVGRNFLYHLDCFT